MGVVGGLVPLVVSAVFFAWLLKVWQSEMLHAAPLSGRGQSAAVALRFLLAASRPHARQ
jgi:hypothetical protein